MADTSSFMDWHPQTPPPVHNPYQERYIPGGWPVDPPTPSPPTTGIFMPPCRPSPLDHVIPVAKRICAGLTDLAGLGFHAAKQLGRRTIDTTTTVVAVPTVYIVRRFQQRRREQRPWQQRRQLTQRSLPPLSQSPWNRAVARELATAQQAQSTPPQMPSVPAEPQLEPVPSAQEQNPSTEGVLYEVPEFRPDYVLNRLSKKATLRAQNRGTRSDRVFPEMPRFTPPREPKPLHLPTPDEKLEMPLLECAKLESPYPQLKPFPATPLSPATTITSVDSTTPSAQLQQGLHTVTESDTESTTVISSIQRSRKRRNHTQGSRATESGETPTSTNKVQTKSPSVECPQTPTPVIVVQDAPSSVNPKPPTPTDTSLLSPPRLKLRRFNTPKSAQTKGTAFKTPKTPQSDISSICDCSPGNYHIDASRSPVKSEISSFFDGTPPPNPEQDAHVFRMIMSGGGSPIPASNALAESESLGETSLCNAGAALEHTSGETSNSNEPAAPETESETNNDLTSTTAEVTSEMAENVLGLANQELVPDLNNVTNGVEPGIAMQEPETFSKKSPKTPERVTTQKISVATPIDLTDDKDTSGSSSSATSFLQTPEKQLAELTLEDVYTPEQPTPKATPHSSEKKQRVTRAESKRLAILEEKSHYEIAPLTEEWEKRIQTALHHGHGTFKARDFTRVVPLNAQSSYGTDQWLNDEVINGYLNLVVAHGRQNDRPTQVPTHHAFVSFFFNNLESRGYDSVKRWASRAKIGGKNLLETEAVFIPVNSGSHWTLCVVSGKNRTIAHYNSMRGSGKRYIHIVKSWVSAELGSAYKESEWTFIETGESPQQNNMNDCGVFTVTSARQIMLGLTPMSYSPDMIPLQRRRIVAELVNGALLKSSL